MQGVITLLRITALMGWLGQPREAICAQPSTEDDMSTCPRYLIASISRQTLRRASLFNRPLDPG